MRPAGLRRRETPPREGWEASLRSAATSGKPAPAGPGTMTNRDFCWGSGSLGLVAPRDECGPTHPQSGVGRLDLLDRC